MDLNQLKTFVTVANTASLTKASALLFLSQPAISAHIKALEAELSIKLFNRTPHGMELTTLGAIMRTEAQNALDAASNVINKAKILNDNEIIKCSLGTISTPVILNLPGVLSLLRKKYHNVNLTIAQNISGNIIDQVINGNLDAGFVIGKVEHEKLGIINIAPMTLCIVGPWSWRDKLCDATWPELSVLPWIATPDKCSLHSIAKDFFSKNHASFNSVTTADEEKTLSELVALELGITLLREDLALVAQEQKELYIWPGDKTTSQLCFIYAQSQASSPIVSALIDTVRTLWNIPT